MLPRVTQGNHLFGAYLQTTRANTQQTQRYQAIMAEEEEQARNTQSTEALSQDPVDYKVEPTGDDVADTLCTLHPLTLAATNLVRVMQQKRPQHVVLSSPDKPASGTFLGYDIALRFSSELFDPARGFSFGRSAELNEVVLDFEGTQKRISQIHFQIFVNTHNVMMLRDTSTNGTIVDGIIVGGKRVEGNSSIRALGFRSTIEILSPVPSEAIRFMVKWPERAPYATQYAENFGRWIEIVRAAENNNWIAHNQWTPNMEPKPIGYPGAYISPGPLPRTRSMFKDQPPNMDETYGMVWDGGSEYKCVGQIGSGAFATVYQVTSRITGDVFAVKEMEKKRFIKNGQLDARFDNEMQIMRELRHPHIVQFIDFIEQRKHLYIVMELVHFGDLQDFIREYGNLNEALGRRMSLQMLSALDYLHAKRITHRDIKPENILVSEEDPFTVKLTDFGLSKVVRNDETFLKTFCGTLLYCAPEVFPHYNAQAAGVRAKRPRREQAEVGRRSYSQQIDIWSFGVVLWTAMAGMPPFEGRTDATGLAMFDQIMRCELETDRLRRIGISEEAIDLLVQMLDTNPSSRPTEEMCFQHPWLASSLKAFLGEIVEDVVVDDDLDAADNLDASQLSLSDNKEDDEVDKEKPGSFGSFGEGDKKRQRGETSTIPRNELVQHASIKIRLPDESKPFEAPRKASKTLTNPEGNRKNDHKSTLKSSGALGEQGLFSVDGAWDDHDDWSSGDSGDSNLESHAEQRRQPAFSTHTTQNLTDSEYETFLKTSQRAVVVEHRLIYSPPAHGAPLQAGTGTQPKASSASSLSGAEAMVQNLRVTSVDSANDSSDQLPDAPSTPKQAAAFESVPEEEETLVTPKQVHFQRTDEDIPISTSLFYETEDGKVNVKENLEASTVSSTISCLDLNAVPAKAALLPPFSIDYAPASSTTSNKENERSVEDRFLSPQTASSLSNDPFTSHPTFIKPAPLLGRLTTTPNSFKSLTLPLSKRVTTWGRHPENTIVYADSNDTRIPQIGLEIWFHARGIDALERDGPDWTKTEDLEVIVRTRSRNGIRVNGIHLTEKDSAGTLLYGKLFTGDQITIMGAKEGTEELKFVCEFNAGQSAARRGASNSKFVVFASTL